MGRDKFEQRPPALPTKPKVNPADLKDMTCDGCGNPTFVEVILLKRVPAFMTDVNKDQALPIPVFACNACGFVNDEFLPSFMKKIVEATETPKIELL